MGQRKNPILKTPFGKLVKPHESFDSRKVQHEIALTAGVGIVGLFIFWWLGIGVILEGLNLTFKIIPNPRTPLSVAERRKYKWFSLALLLLGLTDIALFWAVRSALIRSGHIGI